MFLKALAAFAPPRKEVYIHSFLGCPAVPQHRFDLKGQALTISHKTGGKPFLFKISSCKEKFLWYIIGKNRPERGAIQSHPGFLHRWGAGDPTHSSNSMGTALIHYFTITCIHFGHPLRRGKDTGGKFDVVFHKTGFDRPSQRRGLLQ
ncbi:protein of unknown function [Nitrospina watsonii]|uniref:Uncharacterized protein n=1 Tax=Nitrospina watsonii TaxID=1323948 RepID=A0ABM9HDX9_9BACT|nr:protein of unknown function [Nitrospina watsonii]